MMPRRRQKAVLESEMESVATRTRSGRIVGVPAALQLHLHPGRRARRVVGEAHIPELDTSDPVEDRSAAADPKAEQEAEAKRRREDGKGGCGGVKAEPEPEPEPEPAELREPTENGRPQRPLAGAEKENRAAADSRQGGSIPLGRPKSGRLWKDRNKQRFSALLRDKPLRTSWEKKMEAKREKELVKKYSLQLKDVKAREKEEKRKRREQNLRRREENERKAEIVQVIRNPTKIKRMKKKQLRRIEKRDTLALLQKAQLESQSSRGKELQ